MNSLPDDLLLKIFEYCDWNDAGVLSQISERWREVWMRCTFWFPRSELDPDPEPTSFLITYLDPMTGYPSYMKRSDQLDTMYYSYALYPYPI